MWNRPLEPVNVLVWLAEPLLRAGVRATLFGAGLPWLAESLPSAAQRGGHVVVTDWSSGLCLAQRGTEPGLPSLQSHSKILVIAPRARECAAASALHAGVDGLVLSNCTPDELVLAIRSLAEGARYVCPEVAQRVAARGHGEQLTSREDQVLRLLARGQCNKTIGRQLGIAVGTVKTHVKGVLAKLGASSRTEAASIAAEKGMVEIPEFRSRRAAWQPGVAATVHLPA
ncbi:DNA-binding NarL/FixJ family response regulator [Variovorax sp. 54]|uniref:response regulator transcription factor n=1 Tax=Variovorax sp. 54 TaxID=2035212 RepID=UPI000C17EDFD|nr:response regulator transcription factor [Variovorax sp. 54]PIF78779.1 DNA-binding NarL/FixJ family response regulator [Variovorax sp. 54]